MPGDEIEGEINEILSKTRNDDVVRRAKEAMPSTVDDSTAQANEDKLTTN